MIFDVITGTTTITKSKDGIHYDVHILNPLTNEIEHHLNVTATEAEHLAPFHFQFVK